jgi:transposase
VREVAERLGVSAWSLYEWLRAYRKTGAASTAEAQDVRGEVSEPVHATECPTLAGASDEPQKNKTPPKRGLS